MGRPLNKKYFGNRNIGTGGDQVSGDLSNSQNYGDDRLGGSAVASVTLGTLGSYTARPTITFSDPDLVGIGAVRATGTVTSEVLSAAISGTQTRAYPTAAGEIGFNTGGTTFTATVTSSALTSVVRASATTLGFDTTTTAMISGTSIHITGASITGTLSIGGVAIAAGQIYYVGAPTDAVSATLYATYSDAVTATSPLTIVAGTGVTGATFTRGVTYGTVTALTVVARGSYEALVASGPAVNATYGAGLTITPTYRAKSITITNQGSGYSTATDAAASFSGAATLPGTPTVVMITDTGTVGTAGNQENAIRCYAFVTGGSRVVGDIIRQVSTDRYKVKTADGIMICQLVTDGVANAAGEMDITAFDAAAGEYWVKKLTGRRATLVSKSGGGGGVEFTTDSSAPWTFDAASTGYVQIDNT
jgi:hypothetical protein